MRVSLAVAALCLWSVPALALTQPDGTIIPDTEQVQDLFNSRHEVIDAKRDAAVLPERYVPGCTLNFTLISRGMAAFQNAFGWYNVTGHRPDPSDLHVFISCTAHPGDRFTLDLRHEPAYRGGEIGFFLITPEHLPDYCTSLTNFSHTYFSERAFNDDNMGTSSYIHLLTYDSSVTPQAFYFAWEDLYQGGDNEFMDFVALVDHIACVGGGAPCDTGHPGVCAVGTMQCHSGTLTCMQNTQPSPERCDGLDNDCNGITDDGTGLCPTGQVCDRGSCVPRCLGELGCYTPLVCTDRGTCVEPACVTVTCPAGQRCVAGACAAACDGVACPHGQVCRVGRCVAPCDGVTCDTDQACVDGVCQPRCECRRCGTGQSCFTDGVCRPTSCATVSCPAGQYCDSGTCHDACAGVRCPLGETCALGSCVPPAVATDAGVTGRDAGGDLGAGTSDAGDTQDGAGGFDAPSVDAGIDGGAGAPGPLLEPSSGCGCRAGARGGDGAAGLWALTVALAAVVRRRRRDGRAPRSLRASVRASARR